MCAVHNCVYYTHRKTLRDGGESEEDLDEAAAAAALESARHLPFS